MCRAWNINLLTENKTKQNRLTLPVYLVFWNKDSNVLPVVGEIDGTDPSPIMQPRQRSLAPSHSRSRVWSPSKQQNKIVELLAWIRSSAQSVFHIEIRDTMRSNVCFHLHAPSGSGLAPTVPSPQGRLPVRPSGVWAPELPAPQRGGVSTQMVRRPSADAPNPHQKHGRPPSSSRGSRATCPGGLSAPLIGRPAGSLHTHPPGRTRTHTTQIHTPHRYTPHTPHTHHIHHTHTHTTQIHTPYTHTTQTHTYTHIHHTGTTHIHTIYLDHTPDTTHMHTSCIHTTHIYHAQAPSIYTTHRHITQTSYIHHTQTIPTTHHIHTTQTHTHHTHRTNSTPLIHTTTTHTHTTQTTHHTHRTYHAHRHHTHTPHTQCTYLTHAQMQGISAA